MEAVAERRRPDAGGSRGLTLSAAATTVEVEWRGPETAGADAPPFGGGPRGLAPPPAALETEVRRGVPAAPAATVVDERRNCPDLRGLASAPAASAPDCEGRPVGLRGLGAGDGKPAVFARPARADEASEPAARRFAPELRGVVPADGGGMGASASHRVAAAAATRAVSSVGTIGRGGFPSADCEGRPAGRRGLGAGDGKLGAAASARPVPAEELPEPAPRRRAPELRGVEPADGGGMDASAPHRIASAAAARRAVSTLGRCGEGWTTCSAPAGGAPRGVSTGAGGGLPVDSRLSRGKAASPSDAAGAAAAAARLLLSAASEKDTRAGRSPRSEPVGSMADDIFAGTLL